MQLCLFRVLAKHHSMLRACLAASLCPLWAAACTRPSVHAGLSQQKCCRGLLFSSPGNLPETTDPTPAGLFLRLWWTLWLSHQESSAVLHRHAIRRIWFHVETQTWNFQLEIWTNNFNFILNVESLWMLRFMLILPFCFVYCQDHLSICSTAKNHEYKYGSWLRQNT